MPVNREPQHIDDRVEEESAVRRAPYEQDDAYELQDHEFTLVAEADDSAETRGWPYDEHTPPWGSVSSVPPLPAWASMSRALLEPPTLPRPLNDETPTLVEESVGAISATALRALREELTQSVHDSTAQRARIDQLEFALAAAARAADRATLDDDRSSSELQGRVQGQAARIEELEAAVRKLVARREELEEVVKVSESHVREAAAKVESLERALETREVQAREAADKLEGFEQALRATELQLREASAKVEELEAREAVNVEWIENAAPSVEVTIEVDSNDELPLAPLAAETTLEIDPDKDLIDADSDTAEFAAGAFEPAAESDIPTGVTRKPLARDDLEQIDGIGKRIAEKLYASGIDTFAQLAALERKDLPAVAKQIGVSPERVTREGWIRQARKLKTRAAKRPRAATTTTKRKTAQAQARSRKRA